MNKITYSDLLSVESLTVDGKDLDGVKCNTVFSEILLFENLRYLEIRNTLISNYVIGIIENLDYIENITFRKCTFRKSVKGFGNIKRLKYLKIESCKNFICNYLSDMEVINLVLSKMDFENISGINNCKIVELDISGLYDDELYLIEQVNLKKLIVSHKFYVNNEYLEKVKYDVVVMADDGFYIENI